MDTHPHTYIYMTALLFAMDLSNMTLWVCPISYSATLFSLSPSRSKLMFTLIYTKQDLHYPNIITLL